MQIFYLYRLFSIIQSSVLQDLIKSRLLVTTSFLMCQQKQLQKKSNFPIMNLVFIYKYNAIAKKYHPDALKDEDKDKSKVPSYEYTNPLLGFVQRNNRSLLDHWRSR